jgi:hypothetical protein
VGDNTRVEIQIEIDTEKKMIFYFINKKQCPFYIYDISSSPHLFGISTKYSSSILEMLSIRNMKKLSINCFVFCEVMKYRKVLFFL